MSIPNGQSVLLVKTTFMRKSSYVSLAAAGLFFLFVIGMAGIQFATPDMPDNDGFYHIRLASLMRTEGLKPDFIWLPLTILNPREYADHHFLFHVFLIPFTFGDLGVGAKWAAVIFASLAFLSIWYLLHRQHVPLAWLWALGLLGISDAFLYRMSITRAQSLSLGLLALAYLWLIEGKHKQLAVLSFVYVWMYDAFPLMLALGGLHFLAVALIERRIDFKPLTFIATGLILGLILNPYFPDNIIFAYRHMFPKFADATSVRVGNEWYPYATKTLLENSLPALVAFASGIIALGLANRKMDSRTALGLFLCLFFGLMLFQARRFVEYFPPFALIFAAFAWTPLLQPKLDSVPSSSSPRNMLAPSLFSVAVAFSIAVSVPRARAAIDGSKPYGLYADASAWLVQNTLSGARVFQTDWDDFPRLFFYDTHNTYLVGLDPTYLQLYDPGLYNLWVEITQGRVDHPSLEILNSFGSRYVHTDLNHGNFIRTAKDDPGLKEVYRDEQAVIFEVILP
jgi:hypothetical protein